MPLVTKFEVKQCHTMWYVILAQVFAMPQPQTINPPTSHIRVVWAHEFKLKKMRSILFVLRQHCRSKMPLNETIGSLLYLSL